VHQNRKLFERAPATAIDSVERRIQQLNRDMMRLPMTQRKSCWNEYLRALGQLTDERAASASGERRYPALGPGQAEIANPINLASVGSRVDAVVMNEPGGTACLLGNAT
jgi:hypothetical protein